MKSQRNIGIIVSVIALLIVVGVVLAFLPLAARADETPTIEIIILLDASESAFYKIPTNTPSSGSAEPSKNLGYTIDRLGGQIEGALNKWLPNRGSVNYDVKVFAVGVDSGAFYAESIAKIFIPVDVDQVEIIWGETPHASPSWGERPSPSPNGLHDPSYKQAVSSDKYDIDYANNIIFFFITLSRSKEEYTITADYDDWCKAFWGGEDAKDAYLNKLNIILFNNKKYDEEGRIQINDIKIAYKMLGLDWPSDGPINNRPATNVRGSVTTIDNVNGLFDAILAQLPTPSIEPIKEVVTSTPNPNYKYGPGVVMPRPTPKP